MDIDRPLNEPAKLPGLRALSLPVAAALGLLFAWPVVHVVARSLHWRAFLDVVADRRLRGVAWFTLWQALLSTVLVVAIALPTAGILARYDVPGRRLMTALVSVPFTLPTVVVGAAFLALAPFGHRQGVAPVIAAHVFFNVGMMIRALTSTWETIDPRFAEVARTLGAGPARAWSSVTLPLLRSTLGAVAALVFVLCFTSFGVVLLLGGAGRSTLDVEVYRQALQLLRLDRASALAVVQLILMGIVLTLVSRRTVAAAGFASVARRHPLRRNATGAALVAAPAVVVGLALMPLLTLVARSIDVGSGHRGIGAYRALFHSRQGTGLVHAPIVSLVDSVRIASLATLVAMMLGLSFGVIVAARPTSRATQRLELLTMLPLGTSAVMLGLGFLLAFARSPIAWRSSRFAVPLVQSIVCFPFVVRMVVPALRSVDPDLRRAAQTLGAPPWRAWRRIDARLSAAAFATAGATAFAVALGEFGATSFLARPDGVTMPVAIARLSANPGSTVRAEGTALAVLLGTLTMLVVLLTDRVATANNSA